MSAPGKRHLLIAYKSAESQERRARERRDAILNGLLPDHAALEEATADLEKASAALGIARRRWIGSIR